MSDDAVPSSGGGRSRWYHVVLLGVVAVAFVGFFVGTRESGYEDRRGIEGADAPDTDSPGGGENAPEEERPAPTYGDLRSEPYEANPSWRSAIDEHRRSAPDGWKSEEAGRSDNRAYDGAPPTVPHPVRERSAEACAACHQRGVRVGERDGPAMSHAFVANCIQCHTPSAPKRPFTARAPESVASTNEFDGYRAPGRGPRSYAGAPPRIPHRTQMRSRCGSCHGEFGRPGPPGHGELAACRQCHADPSGPPVADSPPPTVARTNRFRGLDSTRQRESRAWPGAPPQIPHQVHMRENCLACHRPPSEAAVEETSHPWRTQCVQCHAPTDRYDFRPTTNRLPFSTERDGRPPTGRPTDGGSR